MLLIIIEAFAEIIEYFKSLKLSMVSQKYKEEWSNNVFHPNRSSVVEIRNERIWG